MVRNVVFLAIVHLLHVPEDRVDNVLAEQYRGHGQRHKTEWRNGGRIALGRSEEDIGL